MYRDYSEEQESAARAAYRVELERLREKNDELGGWLVIIHVAAWVGTFLLYFLASLLVSPNIIWVNGLPHEIVSATGFIGTLVITTTFCGGVGSVLDLWLLNRANLGDKPPVTPWTWIGYSVGAGIAIWLIFRDFY